MKEQFLTQKKKKTWSKWKWIWLQITFKTYTVKKLNLHTSGYVSFNFTNRLCDLNQLTDGLKKKTLCIYICSQAWRTIHLLFT